MRNINCSLSRGSAAVISALAVLLFAGCQSGKEQAASLPAASPPPMAPGASPPATVVAPPVRIDAGLEQGTIKDAEGNTWLADQGFPDGDTGQRDPDLAIANTTDPVLYRTEHYGMSSFSYPVPNGKYVVKLHFAETYDGITGPGQRVFSFNVEGQEFKNFDVWAIAGGANRACVKTVNVEVTNGKLDIAFTPDEQEPEINGIEILPAP